MEMKSSKWPSLATLVALASIGCATMNNVNPNNPVDRQNHFEEAADKNDIVAVTRLLVGQLGSYEDVGLQRDGSYVGCSSPQKKITIAESQSDHRAQAGLASAPRADEISVAYIKNRVAQELKNGNHIHCSQAVLGNFSGENKSNKK